MEVAGRSRLLRLRVEARSEQGAKAVFRDKNGQTKIMNKRPRQSALRRWRISEEGSVYFLTKCVDRDAPDLILNPSASGTNGQFAETVIECVKWLHENGRLTCDGIVVMPDHVHMAIGLFARFNLAGVIRTFGSYSARRINEAMGRKGKFWQKGYYERRIRDVDGFVQSLDYMKKNPVRKSYVEQPEEWPHTVILPEW